MSRTIIAKANKIHLSDGELYCRTCGAPASTFETYGEDSMHESVRCRICQTASIGVFVSIDHPSKNSHNVRHYSTPDQEKIFLDT